MKVCPINNYSAPQKRPANPQFQARFCHADLKEALETLDKVSIPYFYALLKRFDEIKIGSLASYSKSGWSEGIIFENYPIKKGFVRAQTKQKNNIFGFLKDMLVAPAPKYECTNVEWCRIPQSSFNRDVKKYYANVTAEDILNNFSFENTNNNIRKISK